MTQPTEIYCKWCRLFKPANAFGYIPKRGRSYCKACASAKAKRRYHEDVEKSRAQKRRQQSKMDPAKKKAILDRFNAKHPGYLKWLHRKRKYGVTREEYEAKLATQNNVCAICKGVNKDGRSLAIDHDHNTNAKRGLLCSACNTGLGHFKEDPRLFFAAVDYLTKHGSPGILPEKA